MDGLKYKFFLFISSKKIKNCVGVTRHKQTFIKKNIKK